MSKRYPGGLITKTPVTPTTSSAPGVWTLEQALQYIKAGIWPTAGGPADPYFPYVTMLLHGDGTNGAQNNTFLDSSTNNFSITRNGNTTQGSFSPYGSNWSNYFNGTTDALLAPSNAVLSYGTGNFTVEAWVYTPTANLYPDMWGRSGVGIAFWLADLGGVANIQTILGSATFGTSGQTRIFQSTIAVPANTWTHVAWVRNSGTITVYVNGVSGGSTSNSSSSDELRVVGAVATAGTPNFYFFPGYISNVRLVKGTAVYTSTFTPPTTPLTAIANTSLLTCQSNRFIDNSTNAFTITVNGNTSVQRFSPFSPSAAYSTSVIGGSGYFDGSGDNLSIANTANLQFGTSDYTIEGFVYPTANDNSDKAVISKDASGQRSWFLGLRSSYGLAFWIGASNQTGTNAIALNAWTHFAVVRSGTSGAFFINGTRVATFTDANNYTQTAPVEIGGNNPVYNNPFTGFISNARLVKGTAVYSPASTTITIPTAPLTAVSNTQLLCNMTNGGIFDNAMMNNLETVGNAQISTSVVKFGTGSMAFDGSGDYLVQPYNQGQNFGTGNFTIEGWFYLNSLANTYYVLGGTWSVENSNEWLIQVQNNGNIRFLTSAGTSFYSAGITTGTWYHFAAVRNGTTITLYINGTSVGSYTNSNSIGSTAVTTYWGIQNASIWAWNGYIDDLRITKGYARYTANFTPPIAAFPNN